jgi:hypothetical protein
MSSRLVSIQKAKDVIPKRRAGYFDALMSVSKRVSETHVRISAADYHAIRSAYSLRGYGESGPGSWTKWLLSWFRIVATHGCSCNKMAKKMNEMGGWWCLRNMPEILGVMEKEAEKRGLPFSRIGGRALVVSAVFLSLFKK